MPTIGNLPADDVVTGTEEVPVKDGATTKRIALTAIKAWMVGNLDAVVDSATRLAMTVAERTFLNKWNQAAVYTDGQYPEWDSATSRFVPVTPAGSTFVPALDNELAGSVINYDKIKGGYGAAAGTYPASRITSRTDITIIWTGDTDPGSIAIAGDKWDRTG